MNRKVENRNHKNWVALKGSGWQLLRKTVALILMLMLVFGTSSTCIQAYELPSDSLSAQSSNQVQPIDLEQYVTAETNLKIVVTIDGKKYTYTPEQLAEKNLTVPKGAPVKVELYFKTISGVKAGQQLVYQLPENLMDYSGANEYGYVWQDTVWEENNSGAEVEAADWTIDDTGKLTVTIRDDFFESNKHDDNTVDLFGFNIKFSGSFSSERGEHSGNGDDVVTFRGETNGTGKVSFTIPFEYKNENANTEVKKQLVNYDPSTGKASYVIKVTAPDTNNYTATNVVVTDKIECDPKYIETVKKDKVVTQIYRNCVASTGADTFDYLTGVWTIGDMKPGQTETLTYDVMLSKNELKSDKLDVINNTATVTFNDDGMNQSYVTLDLPNTTLEKTVASDKNGVILTTENGETYATYTLTVTASNGTESNITVKDAFDDATRIKKIVVPDGGASLGTVTIDNDTASLAWKINTLEKGKSATLTYRAYLNDDAWQTTQDPYNPGTVALKINNNASMYIGNSEVEIPALADTDGVSSTIRKTWVKKAGELITDTKDEKYNKLKYTVKVNGDPVSDNITTIYDTLTAGGKYETGGSIEVNRYTSSDKSELVDTTNIPLSEVVSTDGSGYRWDIDLVSRKLNGPYYYELIYYVESTSIQVNNNAGIGFGVGPGYGVGTQVQGGGGMTYGSDYSKSIGTDNKKEAYTPWTVTVQKTIPKGAVYVDRLSAAYVYQHEQFWFDDDVLDDIEITFDGKTLVKDVDYTVKGVRNDDTGYASKTDPDGKRYNQFEITFNNEYQATSSNKLIISYKTRINTEPQDEDTSYSDGCMALSYNYCRWKLPEYGKLVATAEGANYQRSSYDWDTPLKKSNGTYNEDDGTITWNLTVNTNTTIDGDATLVEYLPEGLSFVSAEISQRPFSNLTKDTVLGDITQEEYTNSNGKTCAKVNIPIKSLFGYVVTSSRFPTGVGPYDGWSRAGEVTVQVVTKVNDEWRLNLSKDTKLTNKAVLTDNDDLPVGGVTATGTATVPSSQLIEKSMVGRDIPAYVEYALNVNPDGTNLIPGTDDQLQIVDIMGEGMSLTTSHTNSFKVYDVSNVSDLLDSDGNVVVSKAQNGVDITDQCSVVNITGQNLDGMTEDEVGKPTYLITVPDGKHLAIIYWATFEGAEGDSVNISNRASFFYNNALQSGSGDKTSDSVVAAESSSSLFVGPFFYLKKTDQWGNLVSGVTYKLYEVTVDSSGKETGKKEVMSKTTTEDDETVYFGHRSTDGSVVPQLYKNRLYCLVEESAPAGYVIDSEPYYFEFKEKGHDAVDHPSNVTLHQFVSGCTYSFTNQFEGASYSVPVKKTVNGKNLEGTTKFSFTLTQLSGDNVYTDDSYSTLITDKGIQTTITGSGETTFDSLYFKNVGTYTFNLKEDNLSQEAVNNGYSKDTTEYQLTIEVGKGDGNTLKVTKATFKSNDSSAQAEDMNTNKPTFNNTLHLTGTLNLVAKKEISGNRAKAVQAGEFAFVVSVDGKVVAETDENGNEKVDENGKVIKKKFYTDDNGNINISIPIDQDDIGNHTYVISEVNLGDSSIKYTNDRVKVAVTIVEAGNGKVKASEIKYPEDGAVFTNEYLAQGSVKLQGTKQLTDKNNASVAVFDGEFNFVVMEGDTIVATGTTKSGGEIVFAEIKYVASDIGEHYYTITEKNEGRTFIEYSDKVARVKVNVYDKGDGVLNADVEYLDAKKDSNGHILFENKYTLTVPSTGITLDFQPYVVILAFMACFGLFVITLRRIKRK